MYKNTITLISLFSVTISAFAWDTPREAVTKFVEFDFNGGRLSSDNWDKYTEKYLHASDDYEEPGWDTVVVVDKFSVGQPVCASDKCSVVVIYQLHPTRSLRGPVVPHKNGGSDSLKFTVKNRNGVWKIEPDNLDYPRVSYQKYTHL